MTKTRLFVLTLLSACTVERAHATAPLTEPDPDGGSVQLADTSDRLLPPAADTVRAGTRLQPRYLVGDDGSRQFVGWYDQQLDVDCDFTSLLGANRCLPRWQPTITTYTDPACTRAVVMAVRRCTDGPAFAIQNPPPADACAVAPVALYRLSDPYEQPVYGGGPDACAPEDPCRGVAGCALYQLGERLDPTAFVAATIERAL